MNIMSIISTIFIGPLKLLFEVIYTFASREIGNYGLAIIFLSLAINILVLPLYKRADVMQKESRDMEMKLKAGVDNIKKSFSGDEKMMILQTYYRQNNYSPLSVINGSISLLLQIPFFIAAYQFLSGLIVIKGVSFGPIKDLGVPDGLLVIGGMAINVLPILMTLINFISSSIYLKGFPLKSKIQLYGTAIFFLIFLYNSPSGLVFYWTLNNLFSLVKTIFLKLKNAKKILVILLSICGIGIAIWGILNLADYKRKLACVFVGVALQIPLIWILARFKLPNSEKQESDKKLFILGSAFLAVLVGLLIPSNVIASSPQEFVDLTAYYNPLWTIAGAACMAAGVFFVWLQVFYRLASKSGKAVFDKLVWIACCAGIVNYMFFGTKFGTLTSQIRYINSINYSIKEQLINVAVMFAVLMIAYFIVKKFKKATVFVLFVATISLCGVTGKNFVTIKKSLDGISDQMLDSSTDNSYFTLSQNGKNVVVLFLDRALGELVPYILNEKPELKEQYAGFTFYENTISFGPGTNTASPALLGGYEYTPVEMNKRDSEPLVKKHNESVKMMPVLFNNNGFKTTVADPIYANYKWSIDLSIFDEYPEINSFISVNKFKNTPEQNKAIRTMRLKNIFSLSIVKILPVVIQPTLYNSGQYNQSLTMDNAEIRDFMVKVGDEETTANHLEFMKNYNVLDNLFDFTRVNDSKDNTFFFMTNDLTHDCELMQAPDYTPEIIVDNKEYDETHTDRFIANGKTLDVSKHLQMAHYHCNISALLRIGEWLDYLRENGVYDNTRVIIVADHGRNVNMLKELVNSETLEGDFESYYPLLMVKDFYSKEFTISSEFMTNADVPTLATKDLIENPTNPFTNKPINSNEKTAHKQFICATDKYNVEENNGNTFLPSKWLSVEDNLWDKSNWELYDEEIVLKEHRFPQ